MLGGIGKGAGFGFPGYGGMMLGGIGKGAGFGLPGYGGLAIGKLNPFPAPAGMFQMCMLCFRPGFVFAFHHLQDSLPWLPRRLDRECFLFHSFQTPS